MCIPSTYRDTRGIGHGGGMEEQTGVHAVDEEGRDQEAVLVQGIHHLPLRNRSVNCSSARFARQCFPRKKGEGGREEEEEEEGATGRQRLFVVAVLMPPYLLSIRYEHRRTGTYPICYLSASIVDVQNPSHGRRGKQEGYAYLIRCDVA